MKGCSWAHCTHLHACGIHINVSVPYSLDDLLIRIHTVRQRPAYRRRLLEGITVLDGIGGLRVLRAIERHAGLHENTTIRDVAMGMDVGHSAASRAVDDVSQRGLVSKTPCTDDMRKTRLALSEDGHAVLKQANANRQHLLAAATANWTPEEIATLTGLLGKLLDGYGALETDPNG